jgi:hypothetical protein
MVFASLSPGNAHAGKAFRMSAVGVKYISPKNCQMGAAGRKDIQINEELQFEAKRTLEAK